MPAAAKAHAAEYGLRAETVEGLFAAPTSTSSSTSHSGAHYEVSRRAVDSGKHVYSEKPFVLSLKEGTELARAAAKKKVRIGSAQTPFLAERTARSPPHRQRLGRKIVSGTCHVMATAWSIGTEPGLLLQAGRSPCSTSAVLRHQSHSARRPVRRVMAMSSTPSPMRTISSQPRAGEKIKVETPTTIHACLNSRMAQSSPWEPAGCMAAQPCNMELYGEEGTLHVPDPNFFGGTVVMTSHETPVKKLPKWEHPFSVPTRSTRRAPSPTTAPRALPTWRSRSSRDGRTVAPWSLRCMPWT